VWSDCVTSHFDEGDRRMPRNKVKQQEIGKDSTAKQDSLVSSFRESGRKALGTRIGSSIDWREGSNKSGKISGRYGQAIRDGR